MREFWRQPLVWVIMSAVAVGGLAVALLILTRPQSPVPARIQKQLNFSVVYPDSGNVYMADSSTVTYDAQSKVLIFHAKTANNDLTISEQATPDPFNDIPEYYPKLIEKLNGYADFDSLNGKVSLTRPQELKGGQSAVFNSKGTLMFVHPVHDMSNDQWRQFFNALAITK